MSTTADQKTILSEETEKDRTTTRLTKLLIKPTRQIKRRSTCTLRCTRVCVCRPRLWNVSSAFSMRTLTRCIAAWLIQSKEISGNHRRSADAKHENVARIWRPKQKQYREGRKCCPNKMMGRSYHVKSSNKLTTTCKKPDRRMSRFTYKQKAGLLQITGAAGVVARETAEQHTLVTLRVCPPVSPRFMK